MVYHWLMAVLGQAFVEVHADVGPFRKDLQRQLNTVVKDFENGISNALKRQLANMPQLGQNMGNQVGGGFQQGFGRHVNKNAPLWLSLVSSLASALDDGLSALPMEVKAALVFGALAASPLIAGAISAAVTAGVGVLAVGAGFALASQFETVEKKASNVFRNLRVLMVQSAGAFEGATLKALSIVEARTTALGPRFESIFNKAATFVEPLVNAIFDVIDILSRAIDNVLSNTGGFVDELGNSLRTLALSIGYALEILASTGEDGQKALRDLTFIVGGLVVGFAGLLRLLTQVYGLIRNIATAINDMPVLLQVLLPPLALFGLFAKGSDEMALANNNLSRSNTNLADSTTGVITKTKEEEKQLKELTTALERTSDATFDAIQSNVDFERSLDQLEESLQRNGKTLDINTEKGRLNVEAFKKGLQDAAEAAKFRVATGELTQQQALALYDQEIARLKKVAEQYGLNEAQLNALFGKAMDLNRLAIAPDVSGLQAAGVAAEDLAAALQEGYIWAIRLGNSVAAGAWAGAATRKFAAGGFAHFPETIDVAEDGPEVIIPLTKPARAAELMRQSGLDHMGGTQVMVFIDGQQMEARMVRVAENVTSRQGMALAQGFRGL